MVVTAVPTQTIKQLLVSAGADVQLQSAAAGTTLSVAGAASTNNISVANGSTLELSSTGTNQLTLAFATTATQWANIAGTLVINANTAFTNAFTTTFTTCVTSVPAGGVITNNGGVITGSLASLQMQAGAVYNHAMNGGVIPIATWNATSVVNVTGSVATYPTGFGQTFGDLYGITPDKPVLAQWRRQ